MNGEYGGNMKRMLERLLRAGRTCLPAVMMCAAAGRGAQAAPSRSAAPDAPRESSVLEGQDTEWPAETSTPEETQLSAAMPEEFMSTGSVRQAASRDSLSRRLPVDVGGQDPSLPRLKAPKGWKEDGRIMKSHVSKVVPGPGDLAEGRMEPKAPARVGDLFYVLRQDASIEADAPSDDIYLLRVGVVRAESVLAKGRVRLRVLKAGSEVAPGDMLSRKPL